MRMLLSIVLALLAPHSQLAALPGPTGLLEQDPPRPPWKLELREVLEPDHPGYRLAWVVLHGGVELRFGPALELHPSRAHLASDGYGLPALGVGFGPLDTERLREWTAARIGARVGAFVEGDLRVTPFLGSELSESIVLTGFEREEVLALVGDVPEARPYDAILRVVDGRTGSPIEGAAVEPPFAGDVRALGASRFEVRVEHPESLYPLEVSAPGFHPSRALLSRGRDRQLDELVVELLPPARLEGRVLDAAGKPVSGLRLYSSSSQTSAVAPPWAAEFDPSWHDRESVTDGLGQFALADLPAGGHALSIAGSEAGVGHPASTWLGVLTKHLFLAPGVTTHVLLRLPPRRPLSGQVVDEAGRPVANLTVALQPRPPGPGRPTLVAQAQILELMGAPLTATDEHGAFRFESVPEGAYHLGTLPGGEAGAVAQPIEVDASSASRAHRLVAGRRYIDGRVEGIAGGTLILRAQPAGDPDDLAFWQELPVGPFRFGPLAPGRYQLDLIDSFSYGLPRDAQVFEAGQSGVVLRVPERAQLSIVPRLGGARHRARSWVQHFGADRVTTYAELSADPLETWPHEQTLVVRSLDGYIGAARVTPRAGERHEVEVVLERGAVLRVKVASEAQALRLEVARADMTYAALLPEPGVQQVLLVPAGALTLRLVHPGTDETLFTVYLELGVGGDETIELQL